MKNGHLLGDKIAKLPQWAQLHIQELQRQRDEAVKHLTNFTDEQTPQHFFIEDTVCTQRGAPLRMRRYIHGHWLRYEHRGLDFTIIEYEDHVSIQYGQVNGLRDILMQPSSFQQFKLIYPEKSK